MEPNGESGNAVAMDMGLPMDMVAEEVVTQDDCGTDSDGQTVPVDSLTAHPAVSILNKFGKELGFLEDSSDDEGEPDADSAGSRLYVSGQNAAEEGSGDVWMGSVKDDCLCWECGERFNSLDLLMEHFRMHKACVRCNMCQLLLCPLRSRKLFLCLQPFI
ncbi:hypothetical protein GJAV_G00005300 [Gymnothorax javanicus]|nr:hypothetical protein GJAV_G00005300 [Gymnothorax javanicus]